VVFAFNPFEVFLNYTNKVKEHSVQQLQFLSSNHRVVLPWCTQALTFIELPMDNVNSRGFNVSLAKHHFARTSFVAKMLRKQRTSFNFERFSMLCHTLQNSTWSTPNRCNKGRSLLCACVQFQDYSLQFVLVLLLIYKNL
jgi:hypothetical protein